MKLGKVGKLIESVRDSVLIGSKIPELSGIDEILTKDSHDKSSEENIRGKILDSFLKSSHGDLTTVSEIHKRAITNDPMFYGHLAGWYFEKGSVRDHRELFVIFLITSPYPEHREHGFILLQRMRRYQLARIVKYCKEVLHFTPRILTSAVRYYLKRREKNCLWFDECVIRDKKSLKYLYSTLHIKPDSRAEEILFKDNPPKDSRVYSVKELSKCKENPARQAELILNQKIHYTTAIGAIKYYTPAIIYALASVMTPQQVINNLKFFQERGALDDLSTRAVIEQKLNYGIKENRVNDFKSVVALSKINADSQMAENLTRITAERIKNRGKIKVPTAIFIDKSSSMQACIEIGKLLATMCSSIAEKDLYVYAFDSYAFKIKPNKNDFAGWEKAFAPIKASGCTSIGCPMRDLKNVEIEQILVISDGEENTDPYFRTALDTYEKTNKKSVRVVFLKVGRGHQTSFEESLKGREYMMIHFDGDYYNLPNVIPLLVSEDNYKLITEIMEFPLYTKKNDLENLPPGFNEETYEIIE
jgi:hypothetical protein